MAQNNYVDPPQEQQEVGKISLEDVLDQLAIALIQSPVVDPSIVTKNQKTVKNGLISLGRKNSSRLILYETDVKANKEDLREAKQGGSTAGLSLKNIVGSLVGNKDNFDIEVQSDSNNELIRIVLTNNNLSYNITDLIVSYNDSIDGSKTLTNPLNVSQFSNINQTTQNINSELADEYLNTRIFELIPDRGTRQNRINEFFKEFGELTSETPDFNLQNGVVGNDFNSDDYSQENDISYAQQNNLNTNESSITRLDDNSNSQNQGKTLESLRDGLNQYLIDLDDSDIILEDERPEYENKSEGYLKFRSLNQGIIIRNSTQPYVDGLNPNNPTWLATGFTITMWVKFVDKVSQGTLFNFGSPLRNESPFGFRLETYVLKGDSFQEMGGFAGTPTWGNLYKNGATEGAQEGFFNENDSERFVRLVVREQPIEDVSTSGILRSSHIGNYWGERNPLPPFSGNNNAKQLINATRIPIDFNEWYFICANYRPNVLEDESHTNSTIYNSYGGIADFWKNNVNPTQGGALNYTPKSEYGAKCKVEILSRTDLLRARGFKV